VRPDSFPSGRPYSFGVQAGNFLYLSGQLGRHIVTGAQPEGIGAQTRQAMENIGEVLRTAAMDYANLVKCHVYLGTMDDYGGMNQAYGSFFTERVPARTTVEAEGLPGGAGVEIACIAYRDLAGISVVRPAAGTLPAPLGPYSAAVWAGDTLYLSGMGGQSPEGKPLPESLGEQIARTLTNIRTTLGAAGLGFSDVVSSNVYVTRPGESGGVTGLYASSFTSPPPPWGLLFLPRLPGPIKAELTFVASRQGVERRAIAPAGGSAPETRGLLVGDALYTRTESAPDSGPDFEEQFRGTLRRLESTLAEAGLGWRNVVHVNVYLAELGDAGRMDEIFRETFPREPPARTTIQVMGGNGPRVQAALVARR
jgi:2-iminobutanoate/2-iminopropanoate deaminase